jgi:hypothetical protein
MTLDTPQVKLKEYREGLSSIVWAVCIVKVVV